MHKRFLKIDKKVNQELKKDFNVELMDKKLKDIFIEFPICGRYSEAKNGENHNAELIKEIYENNEETEAIEKLEQTYIQVLDCFRKNNLEKFRDDILNKEIKNGEKESRAKMYVNQLEAEPGQDTAFGYLSLPFLSSLQQLSLWDRS